MLSSIINTAKTFLGGGEAPVSSTSTSTGSIPASSATNPNVQNYKPYTASTGVTIPAGAPAASGRMQTGTTGGAVQPTAGSQVTNGFDINQVTQQMGEQDRARMEEMNNKVRGEISASYQPIYADLDRQLGEIPTQQQQLEGQVGNLAGQQVSALNASKQRELTGLENAAADEKTRGKSTLRNLEQNVRNLLEGASFYLGSMGAGDSSAVTDATAAIGGKAQKVRGDALGVMNQALTQIDRKKADVESIATQNLQKIEDWKANKLFEVQQWGQNQMNELKTAYAQAQGAERNAIAQLIQGTQNEFIQRMRQLDDAVFNYKSSIDTWQKQRQAALEDQMKLMSQQASYSSNTAQQYKYYTDPIAGGLLYANPTNPNDAGRVANTGVQFGSAGQTKKPQPSGFMGLINNAQDELEL